MSSKTRSNPLNAMHTAGIFSDMSIDGPEIGTLVLIVDRAKNLPNRKTIGKQDPYCAARIGKEAKKTNTDIRGGQTPKWDQELRFTVHDSPDYYQMKLSVFNDDKRTDLIGESWIDLRHIVTQGGGQSDQWHGLTCKGKYAGEIRIEITYYDSRPKPEKPVAKAKPASASPGKDTSSAPNQKSPVKRRPLPSDPVTGKAPSPVVVPEPAQTPPRAQPDPSAPSAVARQSPLQNVEFGSQQSSRYSSQPDYGTSPQRIDYQSRPSGRDERRSFGPRSYEPEQRTSLHHARSSYDIQPSPSHQQHQANEVIEQPPPPPVHRARNSMGSPHEVMHRASHEMMQQKASPAAMRHDVLRNEAHRQSGSSPSTSYPGRPTYRPYDSAPEIPHEPQYADSAPLRHHSYDSTYDPHHRNSMQPTVEDVPESWQPPKGRNSFSNAPPYEENPYGQNPSASSLSLVPRNSAPPAHYPPNQYPRDHYASDPYGSNHHGQERYAQDPYSTGHRGQDPRVSDHRVQDHYSSPAPPAPSPGHYDYNGYDQPAPREREPSREYSCNGPPQPSAYGYENDTYSGIDPSRPADADQYAVVPVSLRPGSMQPIPSDITDRIYEDRRRERRYTQPPPMAAPLRGRQQSEPPMSGNGYNDYSPSPSYGHPANDTRTYDRNAVSYSSGQQETSGALTMYKPRAISPSPTPNHRIKRKSVSPAPPPSSERDGRRLSAVPFGPDDYDELNPTVTAAKDEQASKDYTNAYGKIITPDGREVDPSDHLPMDTWAPEPEPKKTSPMPIPDSRSRPSGAQPMPPSTGRRVLRITARPHSSSMPPMYNNTDATQPPPVSNGRNRLQKRTQQRASVGPAALPPASNPLGPAASYQRNSTPPRALVRASTFDYENRDPSFGGSRHGYGDAPPIPAKVPFMSGGLGNHASEPRGGDDWALMQEMSRIDLGSGRARRHGGY